MVLTDSVHLFWFNKINHRLRLYCAIDRSSPVNCTVYLSLNLEYCWTADSTSGRCFCALSNVYCTHSHPQRPRSFWSAPRIILLCLQSQSEPESHWTYPEVVIPGADQKECGLWGQECIAPSWRKWEDVRYSTFLGRCHNSHSNSVAKQNGSVLELFLRFRWGTENRRFNWIQKCFAEVFQITRRFILAKKKNWVRCT